MPFNFSVLGDYYRAQAQLRAATSAATAATSTTNRTNKAVDNSVAPWDTQPKDETDIAKLRDALTATSFVDITDSDFAKVGVDQDQKKLFAIYKGLSRLQALATRAADEKTSDGERTGLSRRFEAGLAQIKSYLADNSFDDLTLLFGERVSKMESAFKVPRPGSLYMGPSVVSGASSNVIEGLTGSEVFTASVLKGGTTIDVTMDLSQITGDLSLDNVVAYMNQQMQTAGVTTRFQRTIFDGKTSTDPKRYGIGIQTTVTEKVTFSAASTAPALYVGGVAGSGAKQTGQLIKIADEGTSAATTFTDKIAPETGMADVRATTTDADGNVFVVGSVTGALGSGIMQGDQDVYLRKYDAAGQLIWSRVLGSSERASGLALATDSDGNVAIAGKVVDRLNSTAIGGGDDTFVTKYDADGREVFTRQIAPVLNDQANALAFGADGSLYVAGATSGAMSSTITHGGGSDAYLMKLTSTGSLDYVRQFGGTGNDAATAVTVDAGGDVILGSVEDGVGVVRKLSSADGTSSPVWEMSLGSLGEGHVSSVAVESGVVYVAGATDNAALTAGGQATVATAHSGGLDGFVMKIADAGSSASASFVSYVGTSSSDSAMGLAVNNGDIYLAGSTSGSLAGGGALSTTNGYVAKLDATGAQVWTHQYESTAGSASARSLSIDAQGASVLDELGLPRGTIAFDETRRITDASSVRSGDYFYVKVNGGDAHKITVSATDTMRGLVTRINASLSLKGEAILTRTGGDGVRITANEGSVIELIRGSDGFDALAGLGLLPGKIDNTKDTQKTGATAKDINVFALSLAGDSSIADKTRAETLKLNLAAAMAAIQNAYAVLTAPKDKSGTQSLNAQRALANYQSALGILG